MVRKITEPFELYAGDTWVQLFELGDNTVEGDDSTFVAEDLSGWPTWACQWRPDAESEEPITLTLDTTDAVNGKVVVSATPEQVRIMGDGGVFDIEASDGPLEVKTYLVGRTTWQLDVTRND